MSWCWWCCHDFESDPLALPIKHDERRNKFVVAGKFCSWSCMKTYALETYGLSKGSIICGNIVMLRKAMYSKIGRIKPAPKRQRLIEFGGDLTIEKFRENADLDTNPNTDVVQEPEVDKVIPITNATNKMYEIKGATGTNEPLRLKRAKPLKRDQNNLETVLGLVIKPKS
jgi:hypothetical protein